MNAVIPSAARDSLISVMTCQNVKAIFDVFSGAAGGNRHRLPPGIASVEDVQAVMRGGMAFLVAYQGRLTGDAHPVGAIGYRWERGTLRIIHVSVREKARGAGVARRLVQAVEAVGFALGSRTISANVGQKDGQGLFEALGYEGCSQSVDRHPMQKMLI